MNVIKHQHTILVSPRGSLPLTSLKGFSTI